MTGHTSIAGDTIAAIATAPGRGGIGVVRLSGPDALIISRHLTGVALEPRHAHFCHYRDEQGLHLDSGVTLYFPGPNSFTGEDVVELQAHGSPVILDMLTQRCCDLGARPAEPGEYAQRAFLNDKIDLAQAEAIADLIESTTAQAAVNATRSLQGVFSTAVHSLVENMTALRVYVEAAIDFPEEEIDFLADGQVANQLAALRIELDEVLSQAKRGSVMREGMKLVIAGKPNAGKSSLLNALSGQETAIVTPIEGTTRDVLREHIQIDGMPLHVVDTAGLRSSDDAVEQEGIRRAWQEMDSADHILLVVDASIPHDAQSGPDTLWPERQAHMHRDIPITLVHNKIDVLGQTPSVTEQAGSTVVAISAREDRGLDLLRQHLKQLMGLGEDNEGLFSARRRHLEAIERAKACFEAGAMQLEHRGAGELLAEDLRQAQHALGEITGKVTTDALLGKIFSSFCIGK